jgi:hypothetical protein
LGNGICYPVNIPFSNLFKFSFFPISSTGIFRKEQCQFNSIEAAHEKRQDTDKNKKKKKKKKKIN